MPRPLLVLRQGQQRHQVSACAGCRRASTLFAGPAIFSVPSIVSHKSCTCPEGLVGRRHQTAAPPGQDSVKWGLNCHTSELQNLNRNGMLRLHFRITFWLLVGVGLEGGQGESKEIGYRSSPAKGELWRRAVLWRGWRTWPHPAWRKFSADGIGLF